MHLVPGPDSVEGDVVPDPDAALRQDAVDEADERERASLADDGPVEVTATRVQMTSAIVAVAREDVIPEDPAVDVVFGPVGDVRVAGDLPGVLDAGFEREPGGVVPGEEILDLPVEPAADQDLRERDRLDGDVYRERERAELMLRNQGAAGKQVRPHEPQYQETNGLEGGGAVSPAAIVSDSGQSPQQHGDAKFHGLLADAVCINKKHPRCRSLGIEPGSARRASAMWSPAHGSAEDRVTSPSLFIARRQWGARRT